ncbi:MAG TPA: hypothetical protein VD966_13790 [Pyrinomonadaceae bacterium]|nr:hypothetical protein [Pyrinomonadaceae bacterium]
MVAIDAEGRREMLEVIDEKTDRLNRFVKGMVELARIEAGEMRLRRRWGTVEEIVAAAQERAALLTRGHEVEVSLDDGLPAVRVDAHGRRSDLRPPRQYRQIFAEGDAHSRRGDTPFTARRRRHIRTRQCGHDRRDRCGPNGSRSVFEPGRLRSSPAQNQNISFLLTIPSLALGAYCLDVLEGKPKTPLPPAKSRLANVKLGVRSRRIIVRRHGHHLVIAGAWMLLALLIESAYHN